MATVSTKSSVNLAARALIILAAASAFSLGAYLLVSALTFRTGFPLDDSWIHLTYARNLALRGEWAFLPGVPSAGSTAPLWSALLALGFLFRLGPYMWTYLLGGSLLFGLAALAELAARRLMPDYKTALPFIGLFFVFEWHFVWAAGSGMETLLHASLLTLVLLLLTRPSPPSLTLGLLTALSVWVRPDGLTLLGPVALTLLLRERPAAHLTRFFLGFALLFGLYLLFNLFLSGNPLPNTFYAKQAEYAAWQAKPLLEKTGLTFLQILTGSSVALLPGVVIWIVKSIRTREWGTISAALWAFGFIGLYALRLPPYQHGRYLMPAMPILFLWGLLGAWQFIREGAARFESRVTRLAWAASIVMLTVAFWGLGARSYGQDVALIESEMVAVAKWVDANLPSDALIAAHDIGALGYFDQHVLIDMAGLVSPEVIPFLRDETQLAAYLDARGADYLIVFPHVYPGLTASLDTVFAGTGMFGPALGGENLIVYRWGR
ncbi:MAG: hypothetical protein HFACDABA_01059 [Anaerolineales bacterium]|nr:hypothetical protein [Anaerolineales bacterium]